MSVFCRFAEVENPRLEKSGVLRTQRALPELSAFGEFMTRLALYVHIVWATKQRRPLLTPPIEAAVYKLILAEVQTTGHEILASNGMPDHVHLLLKCGPSIDLASLMKKIKGLSSSAANAMLDARFVFRWQAGYFAATVTPAHLPQVRAYIENQKRHHRDNSLADCWEDTGENDG